MAKLIEAERGRAVSGSSGSTDMGRFARVVAVDCATHVTQRGNARRFTLNSDTDREVYLHLLRENFELHSVLLIGFCLMSNHVHLLAPPKKADSLAKALKQTHGRYAAYWNAKHGSSGQAWQLCSLRGSNVPGEPKVAAALLAELSDR